MQTALFKEVDWLQHEINSYGPLGIGGKPLKDHFEAIGHGEAYDFLYTLNATQSVLEQDIQQLHPLFDKLYLSDKDLESLPVGTTDIDSLIPRTVPEISKKNIAESLYEAGFVQVFKNLSLPATEAYIKEINRPLA
jgi:hypothetical protein